MNMKFITESNDFHRILTEIANSNNISLILKEFENGFKKIWFFSIFWYDSCFYKLYNN